MYRGFSIFILLTVLAGFIACDSKRSEEKQVIDVDILPFPNKVLNRGGSITLSNNIWVIANVGDSISSVLATSLVKSLAKITGTEAFITDLYSTREHAQSIKIELKNNVQLSTDESYTLDITSTHIKIVAKSANGIYYGMQSLLQLIESGAISKTYVLPKVVIKDSPRFLIRGIIITEEQLSNPPSGNFFQLLGAIKINSVYIKAGIQDSLVFTERSDHYTELYSGNQLPIDVKIVSFGVSPVELEKFYNSANFSQETNGLVLDLTSATSTSFLTKLILFAEISWSNQGNRDWDRFKRLTAEELTNK